MTLAILSALPEEQHGLAQQLHAPTSFTLGGRTFVRGQLHGHEVVLGLTGIGKVAAATTTASLIVHSGVQRVLFTGVAGGIGAGVQVGDVVVAQQFVQHDMDARPLVARWQVPGHPHVLMDCNAAMTEQLQQAAQSCVHTAAVWQEPLLAGRAPQAHAGLVASGDQFIESATVSTGLRDTFLAAGHRVLAVEMEGAAIAQVCADFGVPLAAVRTISDRADDSASVDFPAFIERVASRYAQHIVLHWLQHTPAAQQAI